MTLLMNFDTVALHTVDLKKEYQTNRKCLLRGGKGNKKTRGFYMLMWFLHN